MNDVTDMSPLATDVNKVIDLLYDYFYLLYIPIIKNIFPVFVLSECCYFLRLQKLSLKFINISQARDVGEFLAGIVLIRRKTAKISGKPA